MRRRCQARRDDGHSCGATPNASGLCFWHDPEQAQEAAEARRLGGLRRRKESTVSRAYEFEGLDSVSKITRIMEIAVVDTLSQENSLSRSRTLAYLVQVALKALEVGDMEERLGALEETVIQRSKPALGRRSGRA
jgi:hypothetical protein